MAHYLAFIYRFRAMLLVLIGLSSALACIGLLGLSVTSDTRVFFAADNPNLQQLEDFDRTYSQNNNVLFVVSAKHGQMVDAENLAGLQALTNLAWQLPHSSRVDSLTNFPHIETVGDDIVIGDLIDHSGPWTAKELAAYTNIVATDPQLTNRLVSKDLTSAGVNVNFLLPGSGSARINEINTAARTLAETFQANHPELEVHVTGNVVLMQAFSLAAMRDVNRLVPLALLVILLVMVLTLRSLKETFAVASLLALSAALSTSILGWLNHPLDIATVVAPVIIMTLALASAIHVVTAIHRHMRQGQDQRQAITLALTDNFQAITMTSLTTAIGFLGLNFADAPPFNNLGNLVIIGILINYIFTFTLLPIFFDRMNLKVKTDTNPTERSRVLTMIAINRWPIAVIGIVLIVTSSVGISRITLDDDFIRYFDESFAYRTASDIAEERLTGLNIIEFDLDSGKEDGIFAPAYQKAVDDFVIWIRAQEKVANATAITDHTRKLHKNLAPEEAAINPLPDNRTQTAQYYLLLDMSLPEGRSLSDVISTDQSSSRVTLILRDATSGDVREMNRRASQWLNENAPSLATSGISINVLFAHLSINNIRSMITGTVVSFILISMVIALLLRSISLGAISLFANSVPALVGFGLWGLMVGTVNLGASVLVAMTLGIVVDDTIHFLVAYRNRRAAGTRRHDAIAEALEKVGPAMIITTVSLIAGFAVLSLSGFDVNRTLGTFTAIIIAVALLVDLLLLPAILALRSSRQP